VTIQLVKPLPHDVIRQVFKKYIKTKGVLIESPDLYISHGVKQSGGIPQAIYDMLDESGMERIIDKRKVGKCAMKREWLTSALRRW
jgi:hypothetical protein